MKNYKYFGENNIFIVVDLIRLEHLNAHEKKSMIKFITPKLRILLNKMKNVMIF